MPKQLAVFGVVLAGTAAAYLPSIDGEFLFDDLNLIWNPAVVGPFSWDSAWRASGRPLTTLTFALNHLAAGLDTRSWHVTNIAIHLCVVVLAWLFARLTLARAGLPSPEGPALAAAGLFALHPLQTESVAYISQRAESLASGVYLAAFLLLLLRDEAPTGWRRNALLAGAVALHGMGLAAKPIVATLPAAWLLHSAILPVSGEAGLPAWRRVWRRVPAALPLLALTSYCAIEVIGGMAGAADAGFDIPGLPLILYPATQLRVIPTYLRLLVWPAGQCADWNFPASSSFLEPSVLGGAAFIGAVIVGAIHAATRFRAAAGDGPAAARVASFGALFFLLALSPSSSVIPLRDMMAEHRVCLASLGVFVTASTCATLAVRKLAGSRATVVGSVLGLVVLAAAGIATARRSAVWTTAVVFWSDAAEKAPRKARVLLNLGKALYEADRPADALALFYRARDLSRDGTVSRDAMLEALVEGLLTLAQTDEARAEVNRVLAESPRDPLALALLARVEFVSNRDAESERAALAAIAVDPRNATALHCLGEVRLRRGDVRGARDALRAAAATSAADALIYRQLGEVEERSGSTDAACAAYARAAAEPGNASVSAEARAARASLGCP